MMIFKLASWFFALIVIAIGIINVFWGNDAGFGIFILLLSCAYLPPASRTLEKSIGRTIPVLVKILLGIFILWAALGVGELFNKIELARRALSTL